MLSKPIVIQSGTGTTLAIANTVDEAKAALANDLHIVNIQQDPDGSWVDVDDLSYLILITTYDTEGLEATANLAAVIEHLNPSQIAALCDELTHYWD